MKKINKFLALNFLLSAGLMHVVRTEEGRSDKYNNIEYDSQDDFGQGYYESPCEKNYKEFCDILLHAEIQDLQELMMPGNEIAFMNFFAPIKDLANELSDDSLNSIQSCTYLHILTMYLASEEFFYLQQNYGDSEFKESRCKIIELIKYALEIGVDVNAKNLFNHTPLNLAATFGILDASILFIEAGADVNEINSLGQTPLHLAILNSLHQFQNRYNNYALLEYYDKPLADWKSVIFIDSNVQLVQVLLAAGANVNIFFESEGRLVQLLEFLDEPKDEMAQCEKIRVEQAETSDEEEYLLFMLSFQGQQRDIVNVLVQEFAAIKKLILARV